MPIFKRAPIQNADVAANIEATLTKIEVQKAFVKQQLCPQCKRKDTLQLVSYEIGVKRLLLHGWEIKVYCGNCKSHGVLNQTGFHFELTLTNQPEEEKKK